MTVWVVEAEEIFLVAISLESAVAHLKAAYATNTQWSDLQIDDDGNGWISRPSVGGIVDAFWIDKHEVLAGVPGIIIDAVVTSSG